MIIDFRIQSQIGSYFKADILERFIGGYTEYNYAGLIRNAVEASDDVKMEL
jgi:hypothetical protein